MNNKEIPFDNKYIQNNMLYLLGNYEADGCKSLFRFCSDDYSNYGYSFNTEMTERRVNKLIADNQLRTRVSKSKDVQKRRTTEKAEVFTPRWVCEYQVNQCIVGKTGLTKEELADEVNDYIFNKEWTEEEYNTYLNKTWLETCCGEAPYVVSRYDTVSGEDIAVKNRIGFLDRKIQLISRYKKTFTEWFCDVVEAYRSIYAYEWQGDNLFIARCNLLMTFFDYFEEYFGKSIEELTGDEMNGAVEFFNERHQSRKMVKDTLNPDVFVDVIVDAITKNTTQMDGLTWKRPCSDADAYFFDWERFYGKHTAFIPYEIIFNKAKKKEDKRKQKEAEAKAKAERKAKGEQNLFDICENE